jgi:hypothetical protein
LRPAAIITQTLGPWYLFRVTAAEADELLEGLPLVPAMAGSMAEMKALRERCLAAGIPALVGCPAAGKS